MKKQYTVLLLVLIGLVMISCTKDEEQKPEDHNSNQVQVSLDKNSGTPGAAITFITDAELTDNEHSAIFDDGPIELTKTGNRISFIVPEVAAGAYTIQLILSSETYSFEFTVLSAAAIDNPDAYITSIFSELDSLQVQRNAFFDTLLLAGLIDQGTLSNDLSIWDYIRQQSEIEIASMTSSEKLKLVQTIEANSDWLEIVDQLLSYEPSDLKNSQCSSYRQQGLQSLANNNLMQSWGFLIEYKWCQVTEYVDANTDNFFSKAATLWKNTENQFMHFTLINLMGQKIDMLGKEISQLGNDQIVADEIEDYTQKANLIWENGEIKKIFTRIRFRSISQADKSEVGVLGDFSAFYDQFIISYDDYVQSINNALIWRPEFINQTKTLDFNRFLSIQQSSVTNPKVILINTQLHNDDWEVIFATDDPNNQSFSFEIVYDDGNVKISAVFNAMVKATPQDPVQIRLNNGETPFDIYQSNNLLLDSLTGKVYQGGLILYLNTINGSGIVIAENDIALNAAWGCDSMEVAGADSSSVGWGFQNTIDIINMGCSDGTHAANLCANLSLNGYDDWYLPSLEELVLAYYAMFRQGRGNFNHGDAFWSSTEYDEFKAKIIQFWNSYYEFGPTWKTYQGQVRPVRSY